MSLLPADKTFLDRNWYETLEEFELELNKRKAAQTEGSALVPAAGATKQMSMPQKKKIEERASA